MLDERTELYRDRSQDNLGERSKTELIKSTIKQAPPKKQRRNAVSALEPFDPL